jgi:hypothetical protein
VTFRKLIVLLFARFDLSATHLAPLSPCSRLSEEQTLSEMLIKICFAQLGTLEDPLDDVIEMAEFLPTHEVSVHGREGRRQDKVLMASAKHLFMHSPAFKC